MCCCCCFTGRLSTGEKDLAWRMVGNPTEEARTYLMPLTTWNKKNSGLEKVMNHLTQHLNTSYNLISIHITILGMWAQADRCDL